MNGPHRRRRGLESARTVEVRLSATEYAAVAEAARRVGRGLSLSRFLAEAGLQAAGARPAPGPSRGAPSSVALAEVMAAVVAVNRVGNNLNQLARERNITASGPSARPPRNSVPALP